MIAAAWVGALIGVLGAIVEVLQWSPNTVAFCAFLAVAIVSGAYLVDHYGVDLLADPPRDAREDLAEFREWRRGG